VAVRRPARHALTVVPAMSYSRWAKAVCDRVGLYGPFASGRLQLAKEPSRVCSTRVFSIMLTCSVFRFDDGLLLTWMQERTKAFVGKSVAFSGKPAARFGACVLGICVR